MEPSHPIVASVELGGTKCVCLLGHSPGSILDRRRIPTDAPDETLAAIEAVLDEWRGGPRPFTALGIAAFGPLDLDPASPSWGHVAATPKPGWRGIDIAGRLQRRFGVPIGFDTDVDGAALAEGRWGAARGLTDYAYVTVGTGIGVGLVARNRPVGGFSHAEAGHIRIARAPGDDWPGICPFHGDCVEGLASGPAIASRLGRPAAEAQPDDPVWPLVAHALAQLFHGLVLVAAPRLILAGGGVMEAQPQLFPMVRAALRASLAGYVRLPEGGYVVAPGLGSLAGPCGGLALALDALDALEGEPNEGAGRARISA
ncbi:ROK family protein [Sphingosinicella sp. CPCC 101087]|uniref:ROK family protein n=1 Tax=Sphingosinicella sp. CPCC 101087 TaxID=2497754 RepID=UPI00101C964A|nr:ROK family protein [Sphingosinicella sp. CPCC 101087]